MFGRLYTARFAAQSAKPYVSLLFGARQTGKSTLLRAVYPEPALRIDLANVEDRLRYGTAPAGFIQACRGLSAGKQPATVVIDEAQMSPEIFNTVQHLYDEDKQRWRFILCGSSARKLRRIGANLLPGRSLYHRLFPLVQDEIAPGRDDASPVPTPAWTEPVARPFPKCDLVDRLAYGALPGIAAAPAEDRAALLRSYAAIYLEEEVRREAATVNLASFARFLPLAAGESGQIVNYAALARKTGLTGKTIQSYYALLEDMFVGFSLPAFSGSVRQGVLSTPRFYLFDLGVRHAVAGLPPEPTLVQANPGPLLEQWVAIELWKRLGYLGEGRLSYFRTKTGVEVDLILEHRGRITPIEVKWTDRPDASDARHLRTFLDEHKKTAPIGYIVCRCPRPLELAPRIRAIPWWML
ncbi:MAG: ATP-binding protein [Verrucomicrobia bacterium]|nr:ATP-binding protein [Verrucomicrobiota bacterium]